MRPQGFQEEQIICFPQKILTAEKTYQEKVFFHPSLWQHILDNLITQPRGYAETNPEFKQLVVYIVIKSKDLYLSYLRTPKTTEERLRDKWSIGIGGHVNTDDTSQLTFWDLDNKLGFLYQAVWREINEEVTIKSKVIKESELLCFIDDDTTEVGKVHFGTVWTIELQEPQVAIKGEKGIGRIEFKTVNELKSEYTKYEEWSQLLIDFFRGENK